jgi:high-affinity K+ transport system ATPase subunit B
MTTELYGVGGLIAPFVGIKLIDVAIATLVWGKYDAHLFRRA